MGRLRGESLKKSIFTIAVIVIIAGALLEKFKSGVPSVCFALLSVAVMEFFRYRSAKAMYKVNYVDELTSLPNQEQMKLVMEEKMKSREPFFMAIFDIKNFKLINDLWGFEKGNEQLIAVSKKLKEFSDVFEFACRCENDNFAVIYKNSSLEVGIDVLNTLFDEVSTLPGEEHYNIQYACGITQQDGNYTSANEMFDCAKIAKGIAKRDARTKICLYDEETKETMIWHHKIRDALDSGIKNGEFQIYVQPKYRAKDDSLAGGEALIRWNFKGEGFVPPSEFIPILEEDGSVGKLDDYVLLKICEYFRKWIDEGRELLPLSINISRVQLTNKNLVNDLAKMVEKFDVPLSLIDIELTESAVFSDMQYLLDTMHQVKEKGFRLSMDDFGTGYSSMALLRKMPIDILKLDKSFVDGYVDETCEKDRLMIGDIISMAHHLGITVLAEGVETEAQRDMLKDWGCEMIQGFYYSKPMPIDEYEKMLHGSVADDLAMEERYGD